MKKILVIEDNEDVRENICELLELSGYEVTDAANGKIGIKKVLESMPDLILCDIMMPELDGYGVLQILNNNPKLNHIPLIFLTALADKSDIRKGMGKGAEDYIMKPYSEVDLLEAIELRLKKTDRRVISSKEVNISSIIEAYLSNNQNTAGNFKDDVEFSENEHLFYEGQNQRWVYYIQDGIVRLYATSEQGKVLTHRVLRAGEYIGVLESTNTESWMYGASCVSSAKIVRYSRSTVSELIQKGNIPAAPLIKIAIANQKKSLRKNVLLAYGSVRGKVANTLLYCRGSDDVIDLAFSRESLAEIAGTAKETLIRTLSQFKAEGLSQMNKHGIQILEDHKLQHLTES